MTQNQYLLRYQIKLSKRCKLSSKELLFNLKDIDLLLKIIQFFKILSFIHSSGVCFVQRFRFTLESLPQQETYFGGKSEISDFKAQTIAVTLSAGIHRSKLMLLFRDKV